METKASKAILQEPLKFKIKGKTYTIKGLYLGTLVKLSPALAKLDFDKGRLKVDPVPAAMEGMNKHGLLVARVVAIAILNNPIKIFLFSRLFALRLFWTVDNTALRQLTNAIISQSGIEDFIVSIISLQGLSVTAPKRETSPNGTGGTIAPGA